MNAIAVKLTDWIPGNDNRPSGTIHLTSQTVSACELIRERVLVGYRSLQSRSLDDDLGDLLEKSGIVLPGEFETVINGQFRIFGPSSFRQDFPDFEWLLREARSAFEQRQFILLFNREQLDAWDERVDVMPNSEAKFIRLVPLAGG